MEITLSITELYIAFGGLLALIIVTGLIFKIHRNNFAGIWFIGFCLVNVIIIFIRVLYSTEFIYELPHLINWKYPIGISRPPFFFLFILYLYKDFRSLRWKDLLHFIPVILVLIHFLPFFFTSAEMKIKWLQGENLIPNANLPGWYFYFISFYSLAYLIHAFKIFIKNKYHTSKVLNVFLYLMFIGTLIFLILAVIKIESPYAGELNNFMYLLLASGFILISIIVLASNNGFNLKLIRKYQSSNIDFQKSSEIFKKAKELVYREKMFKNPDLRLLDIAKKINVPSYLLSHSINQQTNKSYNDFINEIRIEEAVNLISNENSRHYTLEAIGYEVGYKSRSSFYSAFKKIKNCTPANYKKTTQS